MDVLVFLQVVEVLEVLLLVTNVATTRLQKVVLRILVVDKYNLMKVYTMKIFIFVIFILCFQQNIIDVNIDSKKYNILMINIRII